MKCNITNCDNERAKGKGLCQECLDDIDKFLKE